MPDLEPVRPPDRHCLLIDQGSSRIKWIVAVWSAMSHNWDLDVTSFGEGGLDDLGAALDSGELLPPEEVLLCSVAAAERAAELEAEIGERCSARVVRLHSEPETQGIRNGYREPEQLGADRWMAVVGGAIRYGTPIVVIDLGTATTLDAVDGDGRHLGGLIIPGPTTMLGSLGDATALKLDPDFVKPPRIFTAGEPQTETRSAVAAGIATSQAGAVREFVRWFCAHVGDSEAEQMKVLVTGGGAGVILDESAYQLTHDPLLIFRGMLIFRFGPGDQ